MKLEPDIWSSDNRIICCNCCKGEGVIHCGELTDYHRGDYSYWDELCWMCDGEGRVVEVNYNARLEFVLPNGERKYENLSHKNTEKLNGRKTTDIYMILEK